MSKSVTIAEARHNLAKLVHQLERQPTIQLTRRGKPVALLVSQQEYQRLTAPRASFWDAYTEFRSAVDLDALAMEPEIFSDTRDRTPGREHNW